MIKNNHYKASPRFKQPLVVTIVCLVSTLTGCASWIGPEKNNGSYISEAVTKPNIQPTYNSPAIKVVRPSSSIKTIPKDGLDLSDNLALRQSISQALVNNPSIKSQKAIVEQARQQKIIVEADQGISLSLNSTNSLRTSAQSSVATKNFDLALQGSWNADLWGRLSDQSKVAQLQLTQSLINLQDSQNTLISDITGAWYQLIHNQKLLALTQEQENNTAQQLAAIETSYQRGLSESLDVYLARGNLESAKSATITIEQSLASASRKLELLLFTYPSGKLLLDAALPSLEDPFITGIPADLLQNRADLKSSWLGILIEDSRTASSYAAQFPQFSLTGNISLSSANLSELFKQNLAWSLINNISQSIFDNGKQKALYKQAKAKLLDAEQKYLQALQSAFSNVEGLLSTEKSLAQQLQLNQLALNNSQLSYDQVTIQYQNGIANYQQVLNVQQQLFNQQKSQLDLQIKRIDNRISLLLALGGTDKLTNLTEIQ